MIIRFLVLLVFASFANAAQAQVPWSMPGSTCVPDQATIESNRHKVSLASVQHDGSNVDRITLNCPVANFSSAIGFWVLNINYRDSTGVGTRAFVRAELYRQNLFTDPTLPVLLTTVTSDSSTSTTNNLVGSSTLTHTFDFNSNTYWVRIEMDRSSNAETVKLYSVFIEGN